MRLGAVDHLKHLFGVELLEQDHRAAQRQDRHREGICARMVHRCRNDEIHARLHAIPIDHQWQVLARLAVGRIGKRVLDPLWLTGGARGIDHRHADTGIGDHLGWHRRHGLFPTLQARQIAAHGIDMLDPGAHSRDIRSEFRAVLGSRVDHGHARLAVVDDVGGLVGIETRGDRHQIKPAALRTAIDLEKLDGVADQRRHRVAALQAKFAEQLCGAVRLRFKLAEGDGPVIRDSDDGWLVRLDRGPAGQGADGHRIVEINFSQGILSQVYRFPTPCTTIGEIQLSHWPGPARDAIRTCLPGSIV